MTTYKGTYNPTKDTWYVIVDDYFDIEVCDEDVVGGGMWTNQENGERYFSVLPIDGWEYWNVRNAAKRRTGHP